MLEKPELAYPSDPWNLSKTRITFKNIDIGDIHVIELRNTRMSKMKNFSLETIY